jgi:hypothetical protein
MEKRDRLTSDTAQTRRTGQTLDAFNLVIDARGHAEADAPAQMLRGTHP